MPKLAVRLIRFEVDNQANSIVKAYDDKEEQRIKIASHLKPFDQFNVVNVTI